MTQHTLALVRGGSRTQTEVYLTPAFVLLAPVQKGSKRSYLVVRCLLGSEPLADRGVCKPSAALFTQQT